MYLGIIFNLPLFIMGLFLTCNVDDEMEVVVFVTKLFLGICISIMGLTNPTVLV